MWEVKNKPILFSVHKIKVIKLGFSIFMGKFAGVKSV